MSADSFLAVVHQRDEARDALSVAREALEKANDRLNRIHAEAKRIKDSGSTSYDPNLFVAVLAKAALAPQSSTVEPPKPFVNKWELCFHDILRSYCRTCAKPTVEPAREHEGHPSTCPACAAKPTAEETKQERMTYESFLETRSEGWARDALDHLAILREDCKKLAAEAVEQMRRAEAAEKSLETANGLLARAAGALGLVDSVSANEAREAIRAHLSLKGAK